MAVLVWRKDAGKKSQENTIIIRVVVAVLVYNP